MAGGGERAGEVRRGLAGAEAAAERLGPVAAFNSKFLPNALAPWVDDIAERLQCPPDYVAVSAVVALGSVIGRRVGIKPQAKTDWIEYPQSWGMFIGPPGMLKSPAMQEALGPLHHLEAEAAKENEIAREAYKANIDAFKLRQQVKSFARKRGAQEGQSAAISMLGLSRRSRGNSLLHQRLQLRSDRRAADRQSNRAAG